MARKLLELFQHRPQEVPVQIVGGNKFGRYPKISDESTFNMYISDGWLVSYAGYNRVANMNAPLTGRGLFASERWGKLVCVIGNGVFIANPATGKTDVVSFYQIGTLSTYYGTVYIDENAQGEIGICDGSEIYILNWRTPTVPALQTPTLPVDPLTGKTIIPAYITFHDGYFITINSESNYFYLSALNDGMDWYWNPSGLPVYARINTKPTNGVAVLRAPGRGNLIYVFGSNVTELWYDVGNAAFPYQPNTSLSIDYGCISASTIATMDNFIAWLGANEKSGPVILISSGGAPTRISTDGIDYKLDKLYAPEESYGFFYKQDGHIFYQITFTDPKDNFSLIYDFNSKMFFYVTDENGNYHIAKRAAYFYHNYYFVSINDGYLYKFSTTETSYDYSEPNLTGSQTPGPIYVIPRVRICPTFRLPSTKRFLINQIIPTIDQGNDENFKNPYFYLLATQDGRYLGTQGDRALQTQYVMYDYEPKLLLSVSKDGAETFSNEYEKALNPLGLRQNKVIYWQLGSCNEVTFQFKILSLSRIAIENAMMKIYV